jgi:hypothetical protein
MCPDCPHVVECEGQIQEKEESAVHLLVTIAEGEELLSCGDPETLAVDSFMPAFNGNYFIGIRL